MWEQCGSTNRVNGQRKGEGRLALCKNIPNKLFPLCVSTVFGETLSEAEHRGLEGPVRGSAPRPVRPLRKSATVREQCGSRSRADGHREGSTGSVPLICFFFFDTLGLALIFGLLIIRL